MCRDRDHDSGRGMCTPPIMNSDSQIDPFDQRDPDQMQPRRRNFAASQLDADANVGDDRHHTKAPADHSAAAMTPEPANQNSQHQRAQNMLDAAKNVASGADIAASSSRIQPPPSPAGAVNW